MKKRRERERERETESRYIVHPKGIKISLSNNLVSLSVPLFPSLSLCVYTTTQEITMTTLLLVHEKLYILSEEVSLSLLSLCLSLSLFLSLFLFALVFNVV